MNNDIDVVVCSIVCVLQVLRYFDYFFTSVFTVEIIIKVRTCDYCNGLRIVVVGTESSSYGRRLSLMINNPSEDVVYE